MVLAIRQAQILINQFNNLHINQQVQMADPVNYVIMKFKGYINPGYPQGLKLYLLATKEIEKEFDKLNISVSITKEIIDHFLILARKYCWGRLALMVDTCEGAKNIFRPVDQINLVDIHHRAHRYFGLTGIGNVENRFLPNPLV